MVYDRIKRTDHGFDNIRWQLRVDRISEKIRPQLGNMAGIAERHTQWATAGAECQEAGLSIAIALGVKLPASRLPGVLPAILRTSPVREGLPKVLYHVWRRVRCGYSGRSGWLSKSPG